MSRIDHLEFMETRPLRDAFIEELKTRHGFGTIYHFRTPGLSTGVDKYCIEVGIAVNGDTVESRVYIPAPIHDVHEFKDFEIKTFTGLDALQGGSLFKKHLCRKHPNRLDNVSFAVSKKSVRIKDENDFGSAAEEINELVARAHALLRPTISELYKSEWPPFLEDHEIGFQLSDKMSPVIAGAAIGLVGGVIGGSILGADGLDSVLNFTSQHLIQISNEVRQAVHSLAIAQMNGSDWIRPYASTPIAIGSMVLGGAIGGIVKVSKSIRKRLSKT